MDSEIIAEQDRIEFECECCEDYYNAQKEFAKRTAKEQTPHWSRQVFTASFRHIVRDDNDNNVSMCLYSNIPMNYCPACGRKLSELQVKISAESPDVSAD